jgi:hypothetical protein
MNIKIRGLFQLEKKSIMVSKVVSLFVFALLVNNLNFIKKNKLNKWKIQIDTNPFIFSSSPKNFSFIHRSSIRHWKKGWMPF